MIPLLIVIAIIVVVGFMLVGTYNRLVGLRQNANQAFADIDVQLKQRQDLIPNLVETVKGYATHESGTLTAVTHARAAAASAGTVERRVNAENALSGALRQLFAVSEAYPDLKANANFMQLQAELGDIENKLAAARRFFNNAVSEYNASIQQFPAVLAGPMGFTQRPSSTSARTAPPPRPRRRSSSSSGSHAVQAVGLQTFIWNNNARSLFLLAGFPVLLAILWFAIQLVLVGGGFERPPMAYYDGGGTLIGYVVHATIQSLPLAIAVAVGWFVIAYFANQTIIDLATGASPISRKDDPELYNLLENLCISRGMKTPTLRIIDSDEMNAFASGIHEGQFSITVTRGLRERLDRDELEAVLAHELTHIINRDVRTMVIAAVFAGIISLVAQVLARMLWFRTGGRDEERRGGGLR